MPIATLRFTLPDEEVEYRAAVQGSEAKALLWDIDQRCRSILKYGSPSQETAKLAEEIREMIGASKVEVD